MSRILIRSVLIASGLAFAAPAMAVDGQVLITQAKAVAGNVTPGDAAGFPVTLSVAGSYKLASDLIPGPNKSGIVAAAPDITIDLNGFRMSGGPAGGTNNSLNGIVGTGDRLRVLNGTIGAFEVTGISNANRGYLIVENMRIINNGLGISNDFGPFSRIQNSTVATNVGDGILCGATCHVEGNVVSNNGGVGIGLRSGTVLGNTIHTNVGSGILNVANPDVGFGNNTLVNNGVPQVVNVTAMFPNHCSPNPPSC